MSYSFSLDSLWELSLFILVVVSITAGWYVGFKNGRKPKKDSSLSIIQNYYAGLNYLIDNDTQDAIDTFINSLEVNAQTFEIHIALGAFLRAKGEVDRAIKIHQNLLARSGIGKKHRDTAHLELARNYVSAGVYDRAEKLLKELINNDSNEYKWLSLNLLLDIYQAEKEWELSIETAHKLISKKFLKFNYDKSKDLYTRIAFYYCEIAKINLDNGELASVIDNINAALKHDKKNIRAHLLLSKVHILKNDYDASLDALRNIRKHDVDFIPETLPFLEEIFTKRPDSQLYKKELLSCLEGSNSISTIEAFVNYLVKHDMECSASIQFLKEKIVEFPTQRGLWLYAQLKSQNATVDDAQHFSIIGIVLEKLMVKNPKYQCRKCGYTCKQLYWLCPSCQKWGNISRVRGLKGE
jgi:lipopolysaccharide assembly protein B